MNPEAALLLMLLSFLQGVFAQVPITTLTEATAVEDYQGSGKKSIQILLYNGVCI